MLVDNIKKIEKKKIILIVAIILVTILLVLLSRTRSNDGMENSGILNVYYRTYTKENGWSKWSKNADTSGNQKDSIQNIEVKVGVKKQGVITYNIYNKDGWTSNHTIDSKIENKNIKAIKLASTENINKKYNICYRTYNDEDKWLHWTCDGEISGNKDKIIKAIEIKIVPRGAVLEDYLKDYCESETISKGFYEVGE